MPVTTGIRDAKIVKGDDLLIKLPQILQRSSAARQDDHIASDFIGRFAV